MILTVEINNLRLYARHGVDTQERNVGNEFDVTVHVSYEADDAVLNSDELGNTINYADLVAIVKDVMAQPSALIEHVACRLRTILINTYPQLTAGYVRVAKLTPPIPASLLSSAAVVLRW